MADPLARFSAPTRAWFRSAFAAPTPAQVGAWDATERGQSALVSAPTGSGKTLAAFLASLDRLASREPSPQPGVRVLYVSPMKALAYDVDRNLRAPLVGIRRAAERLELAAPSVDAAMRTGDTPADERRRMVRQPPDILITTPESLFLLLTSSARQMLTTVDTVIIDEVHAVAGTKRGAHLAVSLERLEQLVSGGGKARGRPLQRVGLSATVRPLDEVARFLGGGTVDESGSWSPRPIRIVEAPSEKELDIEIVVPVEDMSRLGEVLEEPPSGPAAAGGELRRSIWPAVHPRILELVQQHRSTIVFANSRRLAERICARLNELAAAEGAAPVARAHHGSVAREQRVEIEEQLKAGALRCVVATSSLELGIDMGAVDLVVQVESPGSVASGLQRIGRAGHHVGVPSVGKVFPKYRGDLVECAVVVRRMRDGQTEETAYPRNALDVLAQQIVAMAAMDPWQVDELLVTVRQAASYADLGRGQLDGVLDMLSGRYPSDEFAALRPRVNWDRVADRVTGRSGAQRLAVTSGGTIPDRGLYGVFLAGEAAGSNGRGARRVGELDEEMVYETRPGETFTLGSTTWRIEDITRDQVLVTPAPGEPGKLPFWHGDAPGRPVEVGRAVGAFLREVAEKSGAAVEALSAVYGLDELAARNLAAYVGEQADATGTVPSDRTIVVERFRDEIGDWRVCVLSPFGARLHAPWALAITARARELLGLEVRTIHTDDGIVIRLPDVDDEASVQGLLDLLLIDADEVEDIVVGELANSPLFASRFRECAARSLLLPRRRGGSARTPLWQQRQRAADLLAVAGRYGQFPIVLEAYRECLRDVFDLPALVGLLRDVAARRVRVIQVTTAAASPFASSLLFSYVASSMYEGDAPLAERRAQALSLDRELLAELLGSEELRELIDPDALADLEVMLQRLSEDHHATSPDAVHDLLREIGDLRADEVAARTAGDAPAWLRDLERQRRVCLLRIAGEERWVAAEDAARFRDGLGIPPPPGLPEAFTEPVERPLLDLVSRYARTHGPFSAEQVAARLALPVDAVVLALGQLEREKRVVVGAFRPMSAGPRVVRGGPVPGGKASPQIGAGGVGEPGVEWCDADVLRRLRRRSLAALRAEIEPVEQEALGRFLPGWQGVGGRLRGVDRTLEVVEQLQGAPLPASVLERDILAARVRDYTPAWLDELCAAGEVVWVGRGPLGPGDGKVALYLRYQAALLIPPPAGNPPAGRDADGDPATATAELTERHAALLDRLRSRGACFWLELYSAAGGGDQQEVADALWDLVWAGVVTNDTPAPLRALAGPAQRAGGRRRRPGRVGTRTGAPRVAGRWSLVDDLLAGQANGASPQPTERAAALAAQLLDRYGVVTRDVVAAEDVPGGFTAVYGVLKAMEESGRTRRGYFVEGLGGAQFALPGAVDRLRSVRELSLAGREDRPEILAATDPANPYGAALAWPDPARDAARPHRHTPRRVAGAHVVLHGGRLVAYLEKGARSVLTFSADDRDLAAAAGTLAGLVTAGRLRSVQLQRIDAGPPDSQPLVGHLRNAGFVDHPRGLVCR